MIDTLARSCYLSAAAEVGVIDGTPTSTPEPGVDVPEGRAGAGVEVAGHCWGTERIEAESV